MDYDLSRLGDRQFEHLAQALVVRFVGPQVGIFGSGPDGGREATWNGEVGNQNLLGSAWNGYGVVQAKYKLRPSVPKENAQWLITAIKEELNQWAKDESKRHPIPDYYLVITNVVLSPLPGGGIDTVLEALQTANNSLELGIRAFAVWHYDQLRVLLDDAPGIRAAYAAWITPGDVLSQLIEDRIERVRELRETLQAHVAKLLIDDVSLNLTQAGSVGDRQVGIADIFVDVLARIQSAENITPLNTYVTDGDFIDGITKELLAIGDRKLDPKSMNDDGSDGRSARNVLVGGPGQGKSTIGQFICQVYRAFFLTGTNIAQVKEVAEIIDEVQKHCVDLGINHPGARRWPFSVKLTDFADALAAKRQASVLEYIAAEISERAGNTLSVTDLKSWFRSYPWFIIFDGLDEVPAASNRGQVLAAIHDFFLDAASLSADVFILATTRPQGYNDDFDPRRYSHYRLQDLSKDAALTYCKRLLDVRLGANTQRMRRVYSRLTRAADDETTARLLGTPLQATILTLLVERLGQAPKDRWRLFSQYYKVIYQREQEKGGPLAEILHEYESHIHAIHREAGFLLQARGEHAGETNSMLSSEQLTDLIAARLASSGYTTQESSIMAREFKEVFTDRLVFLAELKRDSYGFEIRSLQEFMAGESVVQQLESKSAANLRNIATSSYWRNTILFAIGKIFSERDHLCGEIVALCDDLNLDRPSHRLVHPGSTLALDVLMEGVARTQPAYARPLAACACRSLTAPNSQITTLVNLDQVGMGKELDNALNAAIRGPIFSQVAAAIVLSARVRKGSSDDFLKIQDLITRADQRTIRNLISIAWRTDEKPLLTALIGKILDEGPRLISYWFNDRDRDHFEIADIRLPSWLDAYRNIMHAGHSPNDLQIKLSSDDLFGVSLSHLEVDPEDWSLLMELPTENGPWKAIKMIAAFHVDPSAMTLAATLEECAEHLGDIEWFMDQSSWPLSACSASAKTDVTGRRLRRMDSNAINSANRLRQLAAAARAGELGNVDDWLKTERRWRNGVPLRELAKIGPPSEHTSFEGELPIWPGLSSLGLVLSGGRYRGTVSSRSQRYRLYEAIDEMISIFRDMPDGLHRQGLATLISWASGATEKRHMARNRRSRAQRSSDVRSRAQRSSDVRSWFDEPLNRWDSDVILDILSVEYASWSQSEILEQLHPDALVCDPIRNSLMNIGRQQRFIGGVSNPMLAKALWKRWARDPSVWPLARLALHLDLNMPTVTGVQISQKRKEHDDIERRFLLFIAALDAGAGRDISVRKAQELAEQLLLPLSVSQGYSATDSVNIELLHNYLANSSASKIDSWAKIIEAVLDISPEHGIRMIDTISRSISDAKAFEAPQQAS